MDKYYLLINMGEGFKLLSTESIDSKLLYKTIDWIKLHNNWEYKILIEKAE